MPCAEVERIVQQLADACSKELEDASPVQFPGSIPEGYVTPGQRDQAVVYLLKLSEHFGFDPETFAYAVTCLDHFLSRVKAQTRYLQCISLASLLIAAKLSEEEEYVPKVSDFVTVSRCSHTTADLRRMESVMLQKVEWKVYKPTPVFFLQKFGELLVALGYFPKHLLVPLLKQCVPVLLQLMCQSTLMSHRGSVLALGVLNLELGNVDGIASHWIEELAKFGMVSDEEYIHCCGLINDYLDLQMFMRHEGQVPRKRRRRKRSSGSVVKILPTIWEDNQKEELDEEMTYTLPNEDVEMVDEQSGEIIASTGHSMENPYEGCNDGDLPTQGMILEDKDIRMAELQQSVINNVDGPICCSTDGIDYMEEEPSLLQSCHGPKHEHDDANHTESVEKPGKLLYSTVVKMSCSKAVCSGHSILSSSVLQRQALAY